jgi:hypothetical protein
MVAITDPGFSTELAEGDVFRRFGQLMPVKFIRSRAGAEEMSTATPAILAVWCTCSICWSCQLR